MKIATLLFIAIVSISSFGIAQSVIIGTQTWTTLNLDVATLRNGDVIPEAKTFKEWHGGGGREKHTASLDTFLLRRNTRLASIKLIERSTRLAFI